MGELTKLLSTMGELTKLLFLSRTQVFIYETVSNYRTGILRNQDENGNGNGDVK